MDLKSIGTFIAQLRKAKGLTQEHLGEALHVTSKTISRWETGAYLPPADALLAMSGLFGVSVNELLTGHRLSPEEYREAAEARLTEAVRENAFSLQDRMTYFKQKWLTDHAPVLWLIGLLLLAMLIAGLALREPLLMGGVSLLAVAVHCWRHNAMMAYIEKHAFTGPT